MSALSALKPTMSLINLKCGSPLFPLGMFRHSFHRENTNWIVLLSPGNVNLYGTWNQVSQFSYQDSVGQGIQHVTYLEIAMYADLSYI